MSARLRYRLGTLLYGLPLYGATLGGRPPIALAGGPADPWPGNPVNALSLIEGKATADDAFAWLKDLAVSGDERARNVARALIEGWLETHAHWSAKAWHPAVLGERLYRIAADGDFVMGGLDDPLRPRLLEAMARQARHLRRALPGDVVGRPLLRAIGGLIAWNLAAGDEEGLAEGLFHLDRQLASQIHPDGVHESRSPGEQFRLIRDLVDLRAWFLALRRPVPETLQVAIDRAAPMLRFFRHGDGGLALFNASREEEPSQIALALTLSGSRAKPINGAPHGGFQRLTAGKTVLLVDCGVPVDGWPAHAGTLSFEMSVGKARLVGNLGAADEGEESWQTALRATAAHSTLIAGDTNSSDIDPGGRIGRKPISVTTSRDEQEGAIWLDMSHDGYLKPFGLIHRRRLHLDAEGGRLRGEDTLTGPAGTAIAVRFHLHPSVHALPQQEGGGVLLKLEDGQGWRFRAQDIRPVLEPSLYRGRPGEPRRSQQIVLSGVTLDRATSIKWGFDRLGGR